MKNKKVHLIAFCFFLFCTVRLYGQQLIDVHSFLRGNWKVVKVTPCQIVGMTENELQNRKRETVNILDDKIVLFKDTFYVANYSFQNVNCNKYLLESGCGIRGSSLKLQSDSMLVITAKTKTNYPDPPLDILVNGKNLLINIDGVYFTLEKRILPSTIQSAKKNYKRGNSR